MTHKHTKLWLGIGTCVVLGGPAAQAADRVRAPEPASSPWLVASSGGEAGEASGERASGGEGGEGGEAGDPMSVFASGGEGGEGGEATAAPSAVDSPGVFYSQLALMLGHLHVARELYEAGAAETGAMHLGHPAKEHLARVEAALDQRGLVDVAERIEALARRAAREPGWATVDDSYQQARAAIRSAMADVDPALRSDPGFVVKVVTAILYQARAEYDEAVADGAIVNAHEYHDSRGFVQVGRALLDEHADTFRSTDADGYEAMVSRYEAAMAAWPSPQPPAKPALSVSELFGRISSFEFAASRF